MLLSRLMCPARRPGFSISVRCLSTVPGNPHVYAVRDSSDASSPAILTLLPDSPPRRSLALGTTTSDPPTPQTFTENEGFLRILHAVIREHATRDPNVISQAQAMASSGGATLGSGGVFFPNQLQDRRRGKTFDSGSGAGGGGAGGASAQGGMGGGDVGGWIHVSDLRNPPDFGRIAWPEDIFGSLEVDGSGNFVGEHGNYQESGTYRIVTREGILGLTPYLLEKLKDRLRQLQNDVV